MNKLIREYIFETGKVLQILLGDITKEHVDVIVNAANAYLQHGGGVAGVISLKGGSIIQMESDQWLEENGPVQHASPAYTSGGDLPCKYVIHAVGPIWGEGDEDKKLAEAVAGSLVLGDQLGLSSIAFPAISTGIFRFPIERAAKIILEAFRTYIKQNPAANLLQIRLVLYDQQSLYVFLRIAESVFDHKEDFI
jgi:O-acetyl-ADP-ribose deacetylase (regulator of RNase III)